MKIVDVIWGLNESPRGCPQIECGGNTYYGGMAVQYFFPQLTLSTLRAKKAYQYPDGCPTWIFGGVTSGNIRRSCEMAKPTRGYQIGQNGSWYVGDVARYWMLTGDDKFLQEFYPSLKKATVFTFTLSPEKPYGLISLPEFDQQESFESTPFKGMSARVASIRLYHLKMMELMAGHVGDTGDRIFGNDYAQMMMCWALPAAVVGKSLKDFFLKDGLVWQVIQSGKSVETKNEGG